MKPVVVRNIQRADSNAIGTFERRSASPPRTKRSAAPG